MLLQLWAALTLGALGSFHCAGMCGPIAFALPLNTTDRRKRLFGTAVYNLGRIATYALLGAFFGAIGKGFSLIGMQQGMSIALGVMMLLAVLVPYSFRQSFSPNGRISRGIGQLKKSMGRLLRRPGYRSLFTIGLLNGLLPCGLVYIGVAGAIATGNIWGGGLYMAAFGLGTFPMMAALPLIKNVLTLGVRNKIRQAMPVVVVAIGLLFIVRGLDLGIPYLSPKASHAKMHTLQCCD